MRPRSLRFVKLSLVVALVAYWSALFVATHLPQVHVPSGVSDKTLHFLAYAGLAYLLALSRSWFAIVSMRGFLAIFGLLATYGVVDELSQIPVGRTAAIGDWLADVGGIIGGLCVFALLRALWRRCNPGAPAHAEPRQPMPSWLPNLPETR